MRSLIASTSGRSDEIAMMPMPSRTRRAINAWTSALAPMSMPRVGSSTMRIFGLRATHLAMTIFCWLPPLRFTTACSVEGVLMPSVRMNSPQRAASVRLFTNWRGE